MEAKQESQKVKEQGDIKQRREGKNPRAKKPTAETGTQQTGCRESAKRASPSQPSRMMEKGREDTHAKPTRTQS